MAFLLAGEDNIPADTVTGDLKHAIPAADVVPVRHSWWKRDGSVLYECQNCGEIYSRGGNLGKGWNYCPNCGADMRGADND